MKREFSAAIRKVGINPCVDVPEKITKSFGIKGHIPVKGKINGKNFIQTLVPLGNGGHRLYISTYMRQSAKVGVRNKLKITLEIDKKPRIAPMPEALAKALSKDKTAKSGWEKLIPSRKKEILAYLNSLKAKESVERNIERLLSKILKS